VTGSERTTVVRHRMRTAHAAGIAVGGNAPIAPHFKPDKQPINVKANA
jgi:hypothetical protein